ncbi:alcohol dehydrogenase catalytic domain-containing protein [Arthrobacter sp. HLT1-21]
MSSSPSPPRRVVPRRAMMAVVTTGVGGYDRLVVAQVPVPVPGEGEVLVQVLAAGMNNTEINTRLGWYSSSIVTGTNDAAENVSGQTSTRPDGGWNAVTPFPLIQGADCCGRIVAVGRGGDESVLGARGSGPGSRLHAHAGSLLEGDNLVGI